MDLRTRCGAFIFGSLGGGHMNYVVVEPNGEL